MSKSKFKKEPLLSTMRANLKILRNVHGYSQFKVSELLGVHPKMGSHFETGFCQPRITTLIKLSEIYNISVDDILNKDLTKAIK